MTDGTPGDDSPFIPMTPADAGLHLAGLARAEAAKPRKKRSWERFARLAAYMIQQAFDAGGAAAVVTVDAPLVVRTFRCGCAEPALKAVVDGADMDAVTEIRCARCGKAMTEVEG